MPLHPQDEQVKAALATRLAECADLDRVANGQTGPAQLLTLIQLSNCWRQTWTDWYHWFERSKEEYRAAGKLDEFSAMSITTLNEAGWEHHNTILGILRDECAKRGIETLALGTAIGGINDVHAGRLLLTSAQGNGSKAEVSAAAEVRMQSYTPLGELRHPLDDAMLKLRVACEREITDVETDRRSTKLTREIPKGGAGRRGRLPKDESGAKRMALLAMTREHPTTKYDYPALALQVGVSEDTAQRWVEEEDRKYTESNAARSKPK